MIGSIAMQYDETFDVSFSIGVGAKTIRAYRTGKLVTLEIPSGSTADGGGAVCAAAAGSIPEKLRPSADISVPVVVTENNAKVIGRLVVDSDGSLTFGSSATGAVFTDDAAAGFDRCVVTYSLA